MAAELDKRITPARDDIAADFLEGTVTARRFVRGQEKRVIKGCVPLHKAPQANAPRETELLFGDGFTVYEDHDGWSWGQAASDKYVGYLPSAALAAPRAADHRVIVPLTPLLPSPGVKDFALDMLPLNALVTVTAREGDYAQLADGGFVYAPHLAPRDTIAPDFVAVAERFLGVPYLWGGKSWSGIDCSGLVQTALTAAGIKAPRDTDMIERYFSQGAGTPRRGDLVFWKGHMGVMLDEARLLHANAFHMMVAAEPLADATLRITKETGPPTSVKRPR